MQKYELLCVLPGTLAEDAVPGVGEKIKEAVQDGGGTDVRVIDKGKSRLAYPMKHIRYGYFELGHFSAEDAVAPVIRKKLGLLHDVLRVVLRKFDPKSLPLESLVAITDPVVRKERPATKETTSMSGRSTPRTYPPAPKEASLPQEKSTKAEVLEKAKDDGAMLLDIDKKLDQLLNEDIVV